MENEMAFKMVNGNPVPDIKFLHNILPDLVTQINYVKPLVFLDPSVESFSKVVVHIVYLVNVIDVCSSPYFCVMLL